ncbi:hypothetical protein V9T40_012693 [Parthenolecanium corni]|uniref:Uncharacterized protein n=1 Tax=Parthenolecanium corni TaxID=536013 RepID=A0AAN9XZJ6_9HEMI
MLLFFSIPGLLASTFFLVAFSYTELTNGDSKVELSQDNDEDFMPISSRNYGSTAESANNYYSTYTGYPSYGSSGSPLFTDQYNPSDFSNYYQPSDPKKKPSTSTTYPSYPFYPTPAELSKIRAGSEQNLSDIWAEYEGDLRKI